MSLWHRFMLFCCNIIFNLIFRNNQKSKFFLCLIPKCVMFPIDNSSKWEEKKTLRFSDRFKNKHSSEYRCNIRNKKIKSNFNFNKAKKMENFSSKDSWGLLVHIYVCSKIYYMFFLFLSFPILTHREWEQRENEETHRKLLNRIKENQMLKFPHEKFCTK